MTDRERETETGPHAPASTTDETPSASHASPAASAASFNGRFPDLERPLLSPIGRAEWGVSPRWRCRCHRSEYAPLAIRIVPSRQIRTTRPRSSRTLGVSLAAPSGIGPKRAGSKTVW